MVESGKIENISTIQVLQATIGNPLSRGILNKMSCYCDTCKKNRTDVALELFTGYRKSACIKCRLAGTAISGILQTGCRAFGISKDELKVNFQDPSWRKVLSIVLKGIAKFGVNKPFVGGSPFLIVWDITHACNLKCKHCYANADDTTIKNELNTDEAKNVIDKLDKASVPIIAFSGGEPLLRSDIFDLSKYAHDKGIYVALATNGTLITKHKAKEMKDAGIEFVQISLDGATADTHDKFRGIKGVYEKTIQGITNVVDEGFFVNISSTATKYNYNEIPKIIDLCKNLNVNWFMLYNFVPTGRGENIVENDLSPIEREKILKNLWNRIKNDEKINVLSTAPQLARVALQAEIGKDKKIVPTHFANPIFSGKLMNLAEFIGGCGCGRFYCAIRPNGDIEPCVFFPLTVGNIKNDNFEDVWLNNNVLKELRNKDLLEGNCGECQYRYYCGGCRARAYGYTGNYLSPDPGCILNDGKNI